MGYARKNAAGMELCIFSTLNKSTDSNLFRHIIVSYVPLFQE